jgi:hypothetical protein
VVVPREVKEVEVLATTAHIMVVKEEKEERVITVSRTKNVNGSAIRLQLHHATQGMYKVVEKQIMNATNAIYQTNIYMYFFACLFEYITNK